MGGEICYIKGKERGPWFEIQCFKEIIMAKEAKQQDASFERGLLKSWAGYKGYKKAKEALRECDTATNRTSGKTKSGGIKGLISG